MRIRDIAVLLLTLVYAGSIRADIKPNSLISDHAVLQQGIDVPIWGTANVDEKVTVKFQGQEVSTTAKDGRWCVKLKPLKAGGPFTMTITGENAIEIADLLVGEVWLCSGQSNMQMALKATTNAAVVIESANDSQLRLCTVPYACLAAPKADANARWVECTSKSVPNFSAVAYYFGRDMRKTLHVPVGLIHSSVGGTPAQAWTSEPVLQASGLMPELKADYDELAKPARLLLEKYPAVSNEWQTAVAKAKAEGKPAPRKPAPPRLPENMAPYVLYNGMIAPLQPYALRGVIWYQGEANGERAKQYQTLFPALIKCWRDAWGQGDFPFLFVQITPYYALGPEIREAQLISWQKTTNTAMVVTTDCGEANDVHAKMKEPVGQRLALAARAVAYGEKIEYSGPIYESMKVEAGHAVLSFQHVGSGLMTKDGDLKGFTIVGTNGTFVAAEAKIDGATVVVSSKEVEMPVAVRYGWGNVPDVNLYNKEGLPATPFRTGDPNAK